MSKLTDEADRMAGVVRQDFRRLTGGIGPEGWIALDVAGLIPRTPRNDEISERARAARREIFWMTHH